MSTTSTSPGIPRLDELESLSDAIPKFLESLEHEILQPIRIVEDLSKITVPYTELARDFSIDRSLIEREIGIIRRSNLEDLRRKAETQLTHLRESEGLARRQADRIRGLEIRLTTAETALTEQCHLVQQVHQSVKKAFEDVLRREARRLDYCKQLNAKDETQSKEIEHLRNREALIPVLQNRISEFRQERDDFHQQSLAAQSSERAIQAQHDHLAAENESLQKILGDKTSQIEELRRREHEKDDENMCLQNSLRDMGKRLQETEMKLQQERIEFKTLMEQNESDTLRRMQDQKKAIEQRWSLKCKNEVKKSDEEFKKLKQTYEQGLNEAIREAKQLDEERKDYYQRYSKYRQGIQAYKRQMSARLSREVVTRCQDILRELQICDTEATSSNQEPVLQPIGHLAQRLLDELHVEDSFQSSRNPSPPAGRNGAGENVRTT